MIMTFTCNYRLHRRAGWSALRPAIFAVLHFTVTIGTSTIRITHTLKWVWISLQLSYTLLLFIVFNRFTKKLKDLVRGTIFKWCVLMVEEVCGSRLKPVRLGLR